MSSIQILGQLKTPVTTNPLGFSNIKFVALGDYENVTEGSASVFVTDSIGNYNFLVLYGKYEVLQLSYSRWETLGTVSVAPELATPLSLVELLQTGE